MNTLQKRIAGALVILAVTGVGAYWYASPYLAMQQMRSAAAEADADRFNDRVDYPKLRESIKGQLSARIAGEFGGRSGADNDFERAGSVLGGMLGLALVDRMVDAVVRPETMMRAMQSGSFQLRMSGRAKDGGDAGGEAEPAAPKERDVVWRTERKGIDKILVYPERAATSAKAGPTLVMQREGFADWKLTEIRLPD